MPEYEMTVAMLEDIIPSRIFSKKELTDFLDSQSFTYKKGKAKLNLSYAFLMASDENVNIFAEFIAHSMMFGKSRIVTESFISVAPSASYSLDKLMEKTGLELQDLNFNNIMYYQPERRFQEIYRNVAYDGDTVNRIDSIYARKYLNHNDSTNKIKSEYVWVEIDLMSHRFRLHMTTKLGNEVDSSLSSKTPNLHEYFRELIFRKYEVVIEEKDETELIFNLYKKLTDKNEEEYTKKINNKKTLISDFYEEFLSVINLSPSDDNIDVKKRINRLFVRLLIQKDFTSFLDNNVEGKIRAYIFRNPDGIKLNASRGATTSLLDNEVNIENSSAYFDNKETIEKEGKLFSVHILWNPGFDDITDLLSVRYTAYSGFLETHFIDKRVAEEDYHHVLQKIERIRKSN